MGEEAEGGYILGFCKTFAMSGMSGERYSRIVLPGIFLIQMTVPSVSSIYGVVLGYMAKETESDFYMWKNQITFTPILFTAFWSLTDPWARLVVDIATVPRLVALTGVSLLSAGVLASGYLATGGVGAYLTSLSAAAAMGIGASFLIVQSETVLWQYRRTSPSVALFTKNIANTVGYLLVPIISHLLVTAAGIKTALLLVTIIFLPTALGALLLHAPEIQSTLPYSLFRLKSDSATSSSNVARDTDEAAAAAAAAAAANDPLTSTDSQRNQTCASKGETTLDEDVKPLFDEENNSYFYDGEPANEMDIFVNVMPYTVVVTSWNEGLIFLRSTCFWIYAISCITVRVTSLFFWTLMPLMFVTRLTSSHPIHGMALHITAAFGILIPCVLSFRSTSITVQRRKMYFGIACWLGCAVSLGFTYGASYVSFVICALFGGVAIGLSLLHLEPVSCQLLGVRVVQQVHGILSTVTGIAIILFCFVHDATFCLRFIALLQFATGFSWFAITFPSIVQNT